MYTIIIELSITLIIGLLVAIVAIAATSAAFFIHSLINPNKHGIESEQPAVKRYVCDTEF
jgi:hypothetical protein